MEDSRQHQAVSSLPLDPFFPIREGGEVRKLYFGGVLPQKLSLSFYTATHLLEKKF